MKVYKYKNVPEIRADAVGSIVTSSSYYGWLGCKVYRAPHVTFTNTDKAQELVKVML